MIYVKHTVMLLGQPDLVSGQCGIFQPRADWGAGGEYPGGWRTQDCSYLRPFLCMRAKLTKIDNQWMHQIDTEHHGREKFIFSKFYSNIFCFFDSSKQNP